MTQSRRQEEGARARVAYITTAAVSLRHLLLGHMRGIVAAGYEVTAISSPGPDVAAIESAGIDHIAIEMTRKAFTPVSDLRALFRLFSALRRGGFALVHTHTPKAGLLGRWAARLAGVPVVVHTSHGFIFDDRSHWLWRSFFFSLEKLAIRCSDRVFSVNREDVRLAICRGLCDSDKISVLGPGGIGIDLNRFDPGKVSSKKVGRLRGEIGLPNDVRVVGFVGRLVREKGLLELLEAAGIVRAKVPDVRFLIVGPVDHAKSDALHPETARRFGVSDICIFLGLRNDLPELYSLMEVLVLPSHREGFPRAPMEASAMGIPCVVSDIRGCREVVEHEGNGLLVEVNQVEDLAEAILELLNNADKSRRLAVGGKRMAANRFDERVVLETLQAEYERLLAEKGVKLPEAPEA